MNTSSMTQCDTQFISKSSAFRLLVTNQNFTVLGQFTMH